MKKNLSVLILLLMIFSLCGCNKDEKPAESKFDENALLEVLEANSYFVEKGQDLYVSFNKQQRSYVEMIKNSGYYLSAEISKIEKLEENKYLLTLHVPAFEGNEMTDPYDPYDIIMVLTYDSSNPKEYDVVMSTDDFCYGGQGRIHHNRYQAVAYPDGTKGFHIYLPSRTAVVLKKV